MGITAQRPTIEFEDSVQEDPLSLANTVETLTRAQAASVQTKVQMVHPEWDDTMVQAEADRILAEQGMAVQDPMQSGGFP